MLIQTVTMQASERRVPTTNEVEYGRTPSARFRSRDPRTEKNTAGKSHNRPNRAANELTFPYVSPFVLSSETASGSMKSKPISNDIVRFRQMAAILNSVNP
jgi:hypothetical protein